MNATMTLTPEAREDLLCYLVTTVAFLLVGAGMTPPRLFLIAGVMSAGAALAVFGVGQHAQRHNA